MPHWLAPQGRHPGCLVALPHHRSMGAGPQASSSVHLMSVWTKGQDGVALDPWVHRQTWRPPTDLGIDFLSKSSHMTASQPPLRANEHHRIKRRWNGALPGAQGTPTDLLARLQVPRMPLYTINRGCGARWRSAPFISMLSKLSSLAKL